MIKFKIIKRIKNGNYYRALVPNHPNASEYGYVLEHRVKMENHLGRLLKNDELIHHKNENTLDNKINNLLIVTYKEHRNLHGEKAKTINLICGYCNNSFTRLYRQIVTKLKKEQKIFFCSISCSVKYQHKNSVKKITIYCDYCNKKFSLFERNLRQKKRRNKYGVTCSRVCGSRLGHQSNLSSKINKNDVKKIREMYENNKKINKLAKRFKISIGEIRRIINRKRWEYVK